MGLEQGSNALFLNVSCGKLVNKKKEISAYAYTGFLLDIKQVMDEFEGKPISKIKLQMRDEKSDEVAIISFSEESWYAQGFFARIGKADLSKPLTVGVSRSEQNEKVSFCWLKQGSETIKVEKGEYPTPTKTTRGKDNYDAMLEAIEKTMAEVKDRLGALGAPPEAPKKGVITPNPDAMGKHDKTSATAPTPSVEGDLPF